MSEPSKKAPELEQFLEQNFGRTTCIRADKCVGCGGEAKAFKDEKSRKEYSISGLCQKCQDEIWG